MCYIVNQRNAMNPFDPVSFLSIVICPIVYYYDLFLLQRRRKRKKEIARLVDKRQLLYKSIEAIKKELEEKN